jgi:hypothetical protein
MQVDRVAVKNFVSNLEEVAAKTWREWLRMMGAAALALLLLAALFILLDWNSWAVTTANGTVTGLTVATVARIIARSRRRSRRQK